MSRPFQYLCDGCNRMRLNQPGQTICVRCCNDMHAIRKVYEQAIRESPRVRKLTIPQFVARLYAASKKRMGTR